MDHCLRSLAAAGAILIATTGMARGAGDDSVNAFYGAYSTSVPIEVPAFHGMEPRIALNYASNGGNGFVGAGWNLTGLSVVERARPGKGYPAYDAADIYMLDGQELVPCAVGSVSPSCLAGGNYSTKIENYAKIYFNSSANTWTVWTGNGLKMTMSSVYTVSNYDTCSQPTHPSGDVVTCTHTTCDKFGCTKLHASDTVTCTHTTYYNCNTTTPTFRWGVTKVEDTNANAVNYTWTCTGGDCYPNTISYTGGYIQFYRETRTDTFQHNNGSRGTVGTTTYRLKTILVQSAGTNLRAYKLAYAYSDASNRSQLTSVAQYGRGITVDSAGTITGGSTMPATTLTYETLDGSLAYTNTQTTCQTCYRACTHTTCDKYGCTPQHQTCDKYGCSPVQESYQCNCTPTAVPPVANRTSAGGQGVQASGSTFADIDGDGRQEYITRNVGTHYVTRYTLTGISNQTYTGCHGNGTSGWDYADLDGDGKEEYVTRSSATHYISRYNSNGTCTNYTLTGAHGVGSSGTGFADIDGDGKAEFVTRTNGTHYITNYNTDVSGAFTGVTNQTFTNCHGNGSSGWTYADVDGDGRQDYVTRSTTTHYISRYGASSCTNQTLTGGHTTYASGWDYTDVDGDGKAEFVTQNGATHYITRYNINGLTNQTLAGCVAKLGSGYQWVDVDGDGKQEYITHDTAGKHQVSRYTATGCQNFTWTAAHGVGSSGWIYTDIDGDGADEYVTRSTTTHYLSDFGQRPDLLASITGLWGATTQVSYLPMSSWANTNNPPSMFTVSQVTANDGRGGTTTRIFEYGGGLYDRVDKRFLGFSYAKEIEPCGYGDTTCPYSETWFHQDYGSASMPSRVDSRNKLGNLVSSTTYTYQTNGATVPHTSKETSRWEYMYDATGAACAAWPCAYGKRAYLTRAYDSYGNVTIETSHGDYDASGDEVTTSSSYYPNTSAFVVMMPARSIIYANTAASGTVLGDTLIYYDQTTSWNIAPTKGMVRRVSRYNDSPAAWIDTYKTYDAYGNVLTSTDEMGKVTTAVYDTTYRLYPLTKTMPTGHATTAAYDYVCGKPLTATQSDGRITTLVYDTFCRETQVTMPGGSYTKYAYVSIGTPGSQYVEKKLPGPNGTDMYRREYFDGFGRLWRVEKTGPTASEAIRAETVYDGRGNARQTSLPFYANQTPKWVTYQSDSQDRLIKTTNPDGTYSTASYGLGAVTYTDEVGVWRTEYRNMLGHVTEIREKNGASYVRTRFTYDRMGKPLSVIDDAGNTTTFTHDLLGRRLSIVDKDTGTTSFVFDAASRETSRTDARGLVTTHSYDAAGRVLTRVSGAGSASPITTTFAYDQVRTGYYNIGKMTTVTDASGTQILDHNIGGAMVKSTRTIDGTSYTFEKGYDTSGRLKWTTFADGDTAGTAAAPLTYDNAGRLLTIPGYVTATSYDAAGNVTSQTMANGVVTTRTHDANRGWLSSLSTVKGTTTLQSLTLSHRADGLISQVSSLNANEGWSYTYDDLKRLTAATNLSSSTYNQTFAYNNIGNMTSNSRIGTYTYPATGSARPHAVSAAGSNSYAYDAAGNMTSGAGRTITWDAAGRPTAVNTGTYTYAGTGERIKKVEGGVTTISLGPDYEIRSGTVTKYMRFGDALVAKKVGATKYYLHTDHLGSVQVVTDSAGVEQQRVKYRPYGERLSASTSHLQTRGYTGQVEDDSGLTYLNARYYDPALGRFISADPTMPGDSSIALNRYAYAANNPINHTDKDGLGLFKSIKKAFKKIGKAVLKLGAKLSKIPVFGGIFALAAQVVGGILTGDLKLAIRGIVTLGIMYLSMYVGGQINLFINNAISNQIGAFAARAIAQAAWGAVTGYATARVNGASGAAAFKSAVMGAKMGFAMESFSTAVETLFPKVKETGTGMKNDAAAPSSGAPRPGGDPIMKTIGGWLGDEGMFYEGGAFQTLVSGGQTKAGVWWGPANRGASKLLTFMHDAFLETAFPSFYTQGGEFNPWGGSNAMRFIVENPANFGSIVGIGAVMELAGEKIEARAAANGYSTLGYVTNVSINPGMAFSHHVAVGMKSEIMQKMGLE